MENGGNKLGSVIDSLPAHIALIDSSGLILAVNESWRTFIAPSQLLGSRIGPGKNYLDICDHITGDQQKDAGSIAGGVRQVLNGDLPRFTYEYSFQAMIEQGWFRLTVTPIGQGGVTGAVISHANITAQIRAEESVSIQIQILDNIGQAVIATDTEGEIIYANRYAGVLFGWSPSEMLGQNAMTVTVPQTTFAQANEIKERMRRGRSWSGEFQVRNREGRTFPALVTYSPLQDRDGKLIGIVGVSTDLTERKNLEQKFLRAQRMEGIGTLAGGIAHDLNNILAPVLMSVQMLRNMVKEEEGGELINTLESSLRRGSDLVKQVLAFARGVEGERAPVNLYYLANEIQKIVRDTFPKTVAFHLTAGHNIWPVMGDSTQLQQVLLNLCVNARDAMHDGGTLKVSMENVQLESVHAETNPDSKPGAYVLVKVSDTGPGISPVNRGKIFEPFFTTKALGKGTGLGLSTTLAIVKSHGGFINLHSMVGQGTTFDVYLPATNAMTDEAKSDSEESLPRGRGETILVVDDEEAIRKIAQRLLVMYGYRVLLASHGEEAMAIYRKHRDDIAAVITDMAMPIMDGPTMIMELIELNPDVRIIGSSGLTSNISVTKAAGAGVQHFISKPYTADAMLKTLKRALGP